MPSVEEERLRTLCERISNEHDPERFLLLIRELNILLEARGPKDSQPPKRPEAPAK